MREGRDVSGQTELLMEPGFSVDDLAATTEQ
jgi:3-phenylpropionate/trans-cinnamate dioxygenase ferredoxin reductase subunit